MKYKQLAAYATLPVLGVSLLGMNAASAHGFFGGFRTFSADEIATEQQTMFRHQAEILGLSVDEVKNAWAEGKSLGELAEEKGISQADLEKRMKDAHLTRMKTELQTLVDKGIITQAQADKRLTVVEKRLENAGSKNGMRGMMKMHRGFRF